MAKTASYMLELGTPAPDFKLPDTKGDYFSLNDIKEAAALLVIFMCNHCPYVIHVRDVLVKSVREFQQKGVAVVGINSNDFEKYPDDRPEQMVEDADRYGYTFPYLLDESQAVARAYKAACTPDFFLFDKNRELVYRGQMDSSRTGNNLPVTGEDLRAAVEAVLNGQPVPQDQKPSLGCNIKWKPENEPEY